MTDAEDVQEYRQKLFDQVTDLAKGVDGELVIGILHWASETIRETGIDQIYDPIPHDKDSALYSAFDITWLTLLAAGLNELRKNNG